MTVLSLNNATTTAGTPIGFTVAKNTNSNIKISNNTITFAKPGIYEILGTFTATSTGAGTYGLSINNGNTVVGTPFTNLAAAASESSTTPVYSVVTVSATDDSSLASITLMPVGAPSIGGGTIAIKAIH